MRSFILVNTLVLPLVMLANAHEGLAQKNVGTKPLKRLESTQDDEDTETVLEIDEGVVHGYGGVRWGTTSVDGKWLPMFGLRGAWIYDRKISLGLDFSSLVGNYHPFPKTDRAGFTQSLGTVGLFVEKIYHPQKRFHVTAAVLGGRGFSSFESPHIETTLPSDLTGSRSFFFIAPETTLTVNLTKYLRVLGGISLRLPFGGKGIKTIDENKFLGGYIFGGFNLGHF